MEDFLLVTVQFIDGSEGPVETIARQIREYLYSGEYKPDAGACCDVDLTPFVSFVYDIKSA